MDISSGDIRLQQPRNMVVESTQGCNIAGCPTIMVVILTWVLGHCIYLYVCMHVCICVCKYVHVHCRETLWCVLMCTYLYMLVVHM